MFTLWAQPIQLGQCLFHRGSSGRWYWGPINIKMIKSFFYFIRLIFLQKHLIMSMAKREVATQYVGSLLGFIWTFINPMVMIFVFWVVFSVGFRVQPKNDVPFVVWLTAGMAAWFVFAEIVNGSAGVIISNAHLIKKTLFHSHILPVIKIIACLITHSVFLLVLIGLVIFQRMPFSFYYFQFLYYLFCMCVLALGLGCFRLKPFHQGYWSDSRCCASDGFLGNAYILGY